MNNQVSGVLFSPVSPHNYIFHSLVTSVNRLYRYEQLLWALLNHCVKAEFMVVKELLVCQDQQPVKEMRSSFHGKMFETEDSPILEFCSWNWHLGHWNWAIWEPVFCLQVEDICTGYL